MSLSAVARHGSEYRGKNIGHVARVCLLVHRNIGAGTARQYIATASACKGGKRMGRGRYAVGTGRTPTAAIKKSLHRYATGIK